MLRKTCFDNDGGGMETSNVLIWTTNGDRNPSAVVHELNPDCEDNA